ncbi:hypothetical protein [Flavobacterium sp.]|uniref:hypothetical protein n=1 Tax=Flavobacterium sp. TaxID=239 RepID=UPI002ED8E5F0
MTAYIIFFVFLGLFLYSSFKWGSFLVSDFICGFILLFCFTGLHLEGNDGKVIAMLFMMNLFLYIPLFISSIFIYFDSENEKKTYYIFPVMACFLLVILEKQFSNYSEAFVGIYLPVAGAFFPSYLLNYYKKYLREEV